MKEHTIDNMEVKKKSSVNVTRGISMVASTVCNVGESIMNPYNNKVPKKRIVHKSGITNIQHRNVHHRRRRYLADLYTTLLDSSWECLICLFVTNFYGSWLLFALIYWIIALCHGDFQFPDNCFDNDRNYTCCFHEVDGFSASFLFSLETQHTIGYGSRQTTTQCHEAIFAMSVQSIVGTLIQAFMVGLIFAKISNPRPRTKTVVFSRNAVIYEDEEEKKLCLAFRIGDLRDDNFILGTQISAKLVRKKVTAQGAIYPEMIALDLEPDTSDEPCIFFVWPLEVVHTIDEESPLYNMSQEDLANEKFEIIVLIEGNIETTSMTFQARSSYLPSEVLWGRKLEPVTLFNKERGQFQVNFSIFHATYEVETPSCSSSQLEEYYSNMPESETESVSKITDSPQPIKRLTLIPEYNSIPNSLSKTEVPSLTLNPPDLISCPRIIIVSGFRKAKTKAEMHKEFIENTVSDADRDTWDNVSYNERRGLILISLDDTDTCTRWISQYNGANCDGTKISVRLQENSLSGKSNLYRQNTLNVTRSPNLTRQSTLNVTRSPKLTRQNNIDNDIDNKSTLSRHNTII